MVMSTAIRLLNIAQVSQPETNNRPMPLSKAKRRMAIGVAPNILTEYLINNEFSG
jgi:hypothetical protein